MRHAFVAVLLLLAACAPGVVGPPETTPPPDDPVEGTTTTAPGEDGEAPCLEGAFTEDGPIAVMGDEEGDATRVASLRWAAHPGCERVVIDLATEGGSPATRVGSVQAEVRRDLGIVRLTLADEIRSTSVADAAFDGELAGRAFVVRSPDRSLYVDLHLGAPSLVRAFILTPPARVVVDLRPGGSPLPPEAARADLVVLVTPRQGPLSYPLEVLGYSRTFEANVVLRVRKAGVLEVEEITTAADYIETWGEFGFLLEEGPEPPVTLFVGEDSPRDGSEQGVELELSG